MSNRISAAQNSPVANKEAYELLSVAQTLKNKDKDCAKAIGVYEKSLALRDFRQTNVYKSLAACYAQIGKGEKAFFFLDKMLAVGWLANELRKDENFKNLLVETRGKKFLAKVLRKKAKFAKEISPETYRIGDNPAIRKVAV